MALSHLPIASGSKPESAGHRAAGAIMLAAITFLLAGSALALPASGETVVVELKNLKFVAPEGSTSSVTIRTNDTVRFVNRDPFCHTATRGQAAVGPCTGSGSTNVSDFDVKLEAGEEASVTFSREETVSVFCRPHVTAGMTFTIIVAAPGATPPPPPAPDTGGPPAVRLSDLVIVGLFGVALLGAAVNVYWAGARPAPVDLHARPAPAGHAEPGEVHSSRWPLVVALGTTLLLGGLLFPPFLGLGVILLLSGAYAWVFDDLRDLKARKEHGTASPAVYGDRTIGVLVLIVAETVLFSVLFTFYFWARSYVQPWPPPEVGAFDLAFVTFNTALLLSSGLTAHLALGKLRHGRMAAFRALTAATLVLGAAFLVGQAIEYASGDFSWTSGAYGTAFYALTGTHGAHVAAGLVGLVGLLVLDAKKLVSKDRRSAVAAVTFYWHFVDAVWVFLFAIIYLRVI